MRSIQISFIIPLLVISFFLACKSDKKQSRSDGFKYEDAINKDESENYIEVITRSMEFQTVDTLKSGWNTFLYRNLSNETHFFLFEKLPDGIRMENYKTELVPPFEKAFSNFLEGKIDAGMKELEQIPKWFYDVELYGGVGLVSPKSVGQSSIFLDPGYYAMECYIRMPNGKAHAFMGMLKEVLVLDKKSDELEPKEDFTISVSSTEGIIFSDSLISGNYVIKVDFKDQKQYETLLGHDVNLVKLDNLNLVDSLNIWINAADLNQFRTPAPKGIQFLGGVNDISNKKSGYFTVNLSPGIYAFVSEVPNAKSKGMLKTFTITE